MTLSDMNAIKLSSPDALEGWEQFLEEGEGFLKTAVNACEKRKKTFTAVILYNITAMAIEKFIMAALMQRGALPYNHTMRDLVEAMDMKCPGSIDDIRDGLLSMDRYQEICSLEGFRIDPPDMDAIPEMIRIAQRLRALASGEHVD